MRRPGPTWGSSGGRGTEATVWTLPSQVRPPGEQVSTEVKWEVPGRGHGLNLLKGTTRPLGIQTHYPGKGLKECNFFENFSV